MWPSVLWVVMEATSLAQDTAVSQPRERAFCTTGSRDVGRWGMGSSVPYSQRFFELLNFL